MTLTAKAFENGVIRSIMRKLRNNGFKTTASTAEHFLGQRLGRYLSTSVRMTYEEPKYFKVLGNPCGVSGRKLAVRT